MIARGIGRAIVAGLLLSGRLLAQEPGAASPLRLSLNVPAFRLDAIDGERTVMTVRVAIGTREYPTPLGQFGVSVVTWNPWWFPPPSPWAANDTVTPPCPQNPVGRVKLGFAPLYFIHGTPAAASIGRAASHGCVRARQDDALALAQLVVRYALPDSLRRAEEYASGSATRHLRLPAPVPLEIRYDLAEVRGDTLWMYPDPYRRIRTVDQRVRLAQRALNLAGHDTACIPLAELRRLADRSRRAAAGAAIPRPAAVQRCA